MYNTLNCNFLAVEVPRKALCSIDLQNSFNFLSLFSKFSTENLDFDRPVRYKVQIEHHPFYFLNLYFHII